MDTTTLPESMKIYTLKEAAEILKVNIRSVHRYKKDGRLEAKKVGGQWRVTQEAIERFINGENTEDDATLQETAINDKK